MSTPVIVIGDSGTGKSHSIHGFQDGEVEVVNVTGKILPFFDRKYSTFNVPKKANEIAASGKPKPLWVNLVRSWLTQHHEHRAVVVDDCGYCITQMFLDAKDDDAYKKNPYKIYTDLANAMWRLFRTVIEDGDEDRIVYFVFHQEIDTCGNVNILTTGRMLNEKIKINGLATIVLQSSKEGDDYVFITNNANPAKSPLGMFEPTIPNDLRAVDARIREAYGFAPLKAV